MALLDVFIEKQDAKSLYSLSYLLRCINGKCWEDSPNELRQLDGIGPASVKFVHIISCRLRMQKH